jgi:hypothetical protein
VARAEARERCSVEARLLRVGYLDWDVGEAPHAVLVPGGPVQGPGLLAALGRLRRLAAVWATPAATRAKEV